MALTVVRAAAVLTGALALGLALSPGANAASRQLPGPPQASPVQPNLAPSGNGTYTGIVSTRVLDTRNGVGAPKQLVAAGGTVAVQVTGVGDVPSTGVSAVVVNVAGLNGPQAGYLIGWAHASARPHTSILNYAPGTAGTSNEVTLQVGTDGKVSLFNGGAGPVQLVADLVGYYADGTPSGGGYGAIDPVRLYDSRSDPSGHFIGPGEGVRGSVTGDLDQNSSVPADASAVLINISTLNATRPGYFYGYAAGVDRPHTSVLAYSAGSSAIANEVVVPVGPGGEVQFDNSPTGSVQLILDIVGYFSNNSSPAVGGLLTVTPSRALDTRPHPVAKGGTATVQMLGANGVPAWA